MGQWCFSGCFGRVVLLFVGIQVMNGYVGGPPPAVAVITQNWESPAEGQEISGIQIARGFAFSDTAPEISVSLTVGSLTFDVPWGSERGDVGTSDPQLHSGFGITLNAGLFAPGPVTATLELREGTSTGPCAAPSCVSITRTFEVVKPGGRSEEATSLFEFLQNLDVSGANIVLDDPLDEIIVAPVTVTDSGAGGTRQATLRLRWLQNSQSFATVNAASGTSFANAQAIFTRSCALGGCHDSATQSGEQDLSAGQAFSDIVAMRSSEDPTRFRVNPGDADASYLYQKIIANGSIAAGTGRMPLGCSGDNCLPQSDIDAIAAWINEGAPPPQ